MKLKFVSWNVCGLNDRDKRVAVKAVLRSAKVDVVCLQETKMEVFGAEVVQEILGGRFMEWLHLPAMGTTGGVLLYWDSRVVGKEKEFGSFSVSCLFWCVEDQFRSVFTGVYGPV